MRNLCNIKFAQFINNTYNSLFKKCSSALIIRAMASNVTVEAKGEIKSLHKHLYTKIKACGPISVADYMKEALTHPIAGYYMTRDVFGSEGDFTTSPEISQLFGEMIGVWVLSEWRKISKDDFQLVELGPGRGTLSKDILKVFKQFRASDKVSIHLVEISRVLAEIQAKNLCKTSQEVVPVLNEQQRHSATHYREGITELGNKVFWYHSIEDVPRKFSIFIAHEFFDALPIHKFQKNNGTWHEVFVDIDPMSDEKFRYVISPSPTLSSKLFISEDEKRNHVEFSPQTTVIADYLATFLCECGGFALIGDYGHNGDKTDTFRAFKKHQQQDPLLNPGTADLTADVDFSLIKRTVMKNNRTITFGPVEQREFLLQLGIDVRLNMLLKRISDVEKEELTSGYHMIIDEDKMGKCFKMFAVFPFVLKQHLSMWPVSGFIDVKSIEKSQKPTIDN